MRDSRKRKSSSKPRVREDAALEFFGQLLHGMLAQPDLAPDRLIVLALSEQAHHRILTPRRLELLWALRKKEIASVSELARALRRSLASVSRDLRVLRMAGLVEFSRDGTTKRPILTKDVIIMPIV